MRSTRAPLVRWKCATESTARPDCVRACIKDGSKYVLVADKTVYRLEGDTTQIDKFAGEKATVTGVLSGETLKVATIKAAK